MSQPTPPRPTSSADTDLSRRRFLKGSATLGGGLVIAFLVPGANRFAAAAEAAAETGFAPNAFLRIAADNRISILLAHSEMGQGVWTTLPMLIAEELDADWTKIAVEHAPADQAYAHVGFGTMATGGSTSTSTEFLRYRQAGAAARAMLQQAAASRFGVAADKVSIANGIASAGEQQASFGELAAAAATLPVPDVATLTLKPRKDWKLIGQRTRRLDTPEKITGRATFGMDVQFEGLKTALVARPPVLGGSVKSLDDSAALAVAGVRKVAKVPSGVAVVADHYWAAKQGRDALKIEWNAGPNEGLDTEQLRESFRKTAATAGPVAATAGDVEAAFKSAAKTVEAEYNVPYLAHAPMEPLNCTVKIDADGCEIWTGTQFQQFDQMAAARITGLPADKVKVHTMFLGGGFGRRATPTSDFVSEAVEVAKAAGLPVKTVWTREDDIHGGYYRPMFLHAARIGIDKDGKPVAWQQALVGQSIMKGTPFEPFSIKDGVDSSSVEGVADSPYIKDVAHHRITSHSPDMQLPVLWWRSVGHSVNGFVMESLVDELAHAAGKDPVVYRRGLLAEHPRHMAVLELAAEKSGWGSTLPEGRARGVAVHESFGSVVAQVAEVSVDKGAIRVHKVTCAIHCGTAVNPEGVAAQMESGIAFGLSAALHSRLDFKDGRVQQSNFHNYVVLRLNEMPVVDVHIVPSEDPPTGVGEPGTPPIAAAVANAVFALNGQRLRSLPLALG
ncbi:MAG: xanthine dehydrogenase family protein molybdopterin-binding subunit [Lysobacteraceae bacterium]